MRPSVSMMTLALSANGMVTAAEYPQDGWWWDADASGRGYQMERRGNTMFIASFHYAADGSRQWLTMQGQYTQTAESTTSIGAFVQDYTKSAGSGDLDECDGRTGVTPEFPGSIHH